MIKKKVCLLGAFAVGKTSLIQRYVNGIFSEKYHTTLGVKIDQKKIALNGQEFKFILWDLAGEDEFMSLRTSYLRGAAGLILVADGTRAETLDLAIELESRVREELGQTETVLLINKADLEASWAITDEQLNALDARGWIVIKTSAKENKNVDKAFEKLAESLALNE